MARKLRIMFGHFIFNFYELSPLIFFTFGVQFILQVVQIMSEIKKSCQSCGLPFDKDPNGGGSNADGSKNATYCSYCYQNGAFVRPEWKVEDMQEFAMSVLKKKGVPEFLAKMLIKEIPKLERWKVQ